jgi:hypothetical protein
LLRNLQQNLEQYLSLRLKLSARRRPLPPVDEQDRFVAALNANYAAALAKRVGAERIAREARDAFQRAVYSADTSIQ